MNSKDAKQHQQRLGKRVEEFRCLSAMSHEQLGQRAGLSRASIANIEAGRHGVSAYLLHRLADALNVTADEVLGRKPADDVLRAGVRSGSEWADRIAMGG